MKGVVELNWKLLLILLATLVAFVIIFVFTLNFTDKLTEYFKNFKISDVANAWRNILNQKSKAS